MVIGTLNFITASGGQNWRGHLSCSAIARKITSVPLKSWTEYSGTSVPLKSWTDSALHPGKDFAVSPPMSPSGLIPTWLSGGFFPFGKKRLCSHLLDCSIRAFPATFYFSNLASEKGVRTFLSRRKVGRNRSM